MDSVKRAFCYTFQKSRKVCSTDFKHACGGLFQQFCVRKAVNNFSGIEVSPGERNKQKFFLVSIVCAKSTFYTIDSVKKYFYYTMDSVKKYFLHYR